MPAYERVTKFVQAFCGRHRKIYHYGKKKIGQKRVDAGAACVWWKCFWMDGGAT